MMAPRSNVDTWERLVRYQRRTIIEMDRRLQVAFGRNLDEYDVLHQVSVHGGEMRMGDLAEQLLVANSSCHRIVGRLVDAGFVKRHTDEHDGRLVLVVLTANGKRLRRRMAAVHTRDIQALFGSQLSASQTTELDAILRSLLADGMPSESTAP